jgi:membrane-bound metal-dependent hydrolase YbcI (DUF457 family)
MDFFAHFLIGLIVASLADGSNLDLYVSLCVLMSLLPDLDFILFPFWKRHPFSGHHGITHTPAFIFAVSILIYGALSIFMGISDIRLLLVLMITGFLHIFCDFLGTGGVPLFYPFNMKYFKLNIALGIDPLLTVFSIAGIAVLFKTYLNPNIPDIREVTVLIASIFIFYYAARAVLKHKEEHRPENLGFTALPTINPLRWKYASRTETKDAIKISLKTAEGIKTFTIPKDKQKKIEQCKDLVYTYWHPLVQGEMRFFEYPCYKLLCQEDRMEIIWNSAEAGKIMDVKVSLEDGQLIADKKFRNKKWWP